MKYFALLSMLLLICGFGGVALAAGPDTGFYLGVAGNILMMNGTGELDGEDFEIDADIFLEDPSDPFGFSWENKMLFGAKPVVGYKVSPMFAVQGGYNYFLTKSSDQTISDEYYDGSEFWIEEDLTAEVEWKQSSIELIGIFYPSPESNFFIFAGMEKVTMELDIKMTAEVSVYEYEGGSLYGTDSVSESDKDDTSTTGMILGGGVEMPMGETQASFFSVQYSTATLDDDLFKNGYFQMDDFEVKIGGISASFGFKWYMSSM